MSQIEFVDMLWERVKATGSQKALAKELGISCAYLNDVLSSRRDVSYELANKLGYRRVVCFVHKEQNP